MPRLRRILFGALAAGSLALFVLVCVLWVRGKSVTDSVEFRYDRYLADKSAAATSVSLRSDDRRIRLRIHWGWVGPFNGNLVYGYYLNADRSGGKPTLRLRHSPHAETWD